MSFLTGLRASTSRLSRPSHRRPQSLLATPTSRSFATTTSAPPSPTKTFGSTIQEADNVLADQKRQVELAKRTGQQIDVTSLAIPVLEAITEPRLSWRSWFRTLSKREGRNYLMERAIYGNEKVLGRLRLTLASLKDMEARGTYDPSIESGWYHRVWFYLRFQPTYRAQYMLDDAWRIYTAYYAAQATGDVFALRRVSFDKALQSGSAVASTGKKMSWKLADWNERPKVMWARVAPLDSEGKLHAGQICVRFDTQQALSVFTPGGKVKSRKEQRVVDHFIFERFTPPRGAWRLKEKVETTMPEFLVEEPKAEKEDGARPGARTVAAGRGARR